VVWQGLQSAPLWVWLAGVIGAFYVTSVIILAPKLGAALTFSLVVLGQMALSLLMDHFAWLGIPQHSFSFWRMLGVALIIGGVAILRFK
ncbi:MAG: DMT family transporter, partial [Candidatus Sericytochromatia bacterium]